MWSTEACSTDARRIRPCSSGSARKLSRSRGSSTRSMLAFSFGSAAAPPAEADQTSTWLRFSRRISTSASWRAAYYYAPATSRWVLLAALQFPLEAARQLADVAGVTTADAADEPVLLPDVD